MDKSPSGKRNREITPVQFELPDCYRYCFDLIKLSRMKFRQTESISLLLSLVLN